MGRAEGNGACSQQKPKNKDTQAEVKGGRQKIQPPESPSQGQRRGPMAGQNMKAEAQQRRPGDRDQAVVGGKGRPVCPPDRAEKRVHLEALACLGPQQEHILWGTESHCQ